VLRQVGEYAALSLPWDMVLCYRDSSGSVAQWVSFVSQVVANHGHELAALAGRRGPRRHRTDGTSARIEPA
jgi:hypothetical protein